MGDEDAGLSRGGGARPTAPAAMYPALPKWPIAIESSPVIRRVQGWASAGSDTIRMPSSTAPSTTTTTVGIPAEAMTIVIRVAMNSRWWPVRKT